MGLAEAARNGYKEKTFLNSTRPSDSMVSFDSEIPEAQLASSPACAVNLSGRVTVVYGPLARVQLQLNL